MALADKLRGFKLEKLRLKEKRAVAVDIGFTSIKVLELHGGGTKWKLGRWAYLPYGSGGETAAPERRNQQVAVLKDYFGKQKDKISHSAVFSVSGSSVIVRYVKFTKMSRDEFSRAITVEAEQYIPFAIPEVHLDFHILGDTLEDGQKKMETILVAAKRELVAQRLDVIRSAGLKPLLIDVDAFALANAYEIIRPPALKETVMIVHIGAFVTTMVILESGVPRVVRDVFIAGNTVTKALQRNFQCDVKQADVMKAGAQLLATQEERERAMAQQNKELLQMSTVMLPVMKDLLGEIQRSLDFFLSQGADRQVARVLLSGGTARLGSLGSFLSQELRLPVEMFDPLVKVEGAQAIGPDLRPLFTVAAGLAVRRDGDAG
jgi:type IV pilus assembly protein PilM